MKEKKSVKAEGIRVVRAAGSKDRHSKVCTARGTRDRRVRLSPKTAILFYDVQDRLGYDRPSKAIDWLMKEAKAAIDALDHPDPTKNPQKHSHSFELSNEGNAPPPTTRSEDYQEQLLTPLELFNANPEIFRRQGILFADAGGGEDYSSVMFSPEREPLQSSFWGIKENSPEFEGFKDFYGGSTFQQEAEKGKIPVLSESPCFLDYEE